MSLENEYRAGSGVSLLIVIVLLGMGAIAIWGKEDGRAKYPEPELLVIITDENVERIGATLTGR